MGLWYAGRIPRNAERMASPWTGKQVLIIGDSLSDGTTRKRLPDGTYVQEGTRGVPPDPPTTPGQFLAVWLRQAGAKAVRIQARSGRSAAHWIKYRDCVWYAKDGTCIEFYPKGALEIIADEIRNHRPDVAIIILGTNDLGYPAEVNRSAFRRLKQAFDQAGIPVFHVGPPAFDPTRRAKEHRLSEAVVAVGREVFGKRFLDARPLTRDILTPAEGRASDGIHFTVAGAKRWAARLADALTQLVDAQEPTSPTPVSPTPMSPAPMSPTPASRGAATRRFAALFTVGGVALLAFFGFLLIRRVRARRVAIAGPTRGVRSAAASERGEV